MKRGKNNNRAQSGIITTVLIILLVLAAVVIVWNVIKGTVKEGAEEIGIEAFTASVKIEDAKIYISGDAGIKVKKESGAGNMTSLKFVFEQEDGKTSIIERKRADGYEIPDELETKTYNFSYNEIKPDKKITKISVIPMLNEKSGIENPADESKITEANDEGVYYSNLIPNWQMETNKNWTSGPRSVIASDMNGIYHYSHRSDETDTGCYNWAYSEQIPADPSKAYKFSIWIKSNDTSMNNYLGFWILNSSQNKIEGDWHNPYFKTTDNDLNEWKKWEGYLGPSSAGGATDCDSAKTNGNDWCMANTAAYMLIRFGSCYGNGGNNGSSWFIYPKIEEVGWPPE